MTRITKAQLEKQNKALRQLFNLTLMFLIGLALDKKISKELANSIDLHVHSQIQTIKENIDVS